MHREIKFRGKDIETGEWVVGDLHLLCDRPHIHTANSPFPYAGKRSFIDENSIGQYTGLHDKNGKEIYEGDILRIREYKNLSFGIGTIAEDEEMRNSYTLEELKGELLAESVSSVCWEESTFLVSIDWENDTYLSCLWGDMKKSQPIFDFEVIGNIHDNLDIEIKYSERYKKKESQKEEK